MASGRAHHLSPLSFPLEHLTLGRVYGSGHWHFRGPVKGKRSWEFVILVVFFSFLNYAFVVSFFFLIILFILFLALLGLCCCTDFSLVVASRRYSPAAGCRLLIAVASSVADRGL